MNQVMTQKPHEMLAATLAEELDAVNLLIRERMASKHAPRIPEVTAHLVEAAWQASAPDADVGGGTDVWLRGRSPSETGSNGRVHSYRDAAA